MKDKDKKRKSKAMIDGIKAIIYLQSLAGYHRDSSGCGKGLAAHEHR